MRSKCNNSLRIIVAALALGGSCAAAIADEVTDRSQDPNLWAAPGGDQALTRHSALKSINASNVRHLQMVDRKSTRLNSSHLGISYAVFCLKKKKKKKYNYKVITNNRETHPH